MTSDRRPSFYNSVKTSRSSDESPRSPQTTAAPGINLIPSACNASALTLKNDHDTKASASPKSEVCLIVGNLMKVDDGTTRKNAPRKGLSFRSLRFTETFDGEDPMVTAVMECNSKPVLGRSTSVRSLKRMETLGCEDLRVSSLMDAHATGAHDNRKASIGKSNSMRNLKTVETLSGEDMLVASVMQAHKGRSHDE